MIIHTIGSDVLRRKALPVEKIDDDLIKFIQEMLETMYEKDGLGLAAPQVGKSIRVFVIDYDWVNEEKKNPLIFINPEIISMSGTIEYEEGCLSLPGIFTTVKRANNIKVKALDLKGETRYYDFDEVKAVAFQHELDHLNGVLFIDRVPKLKLLGLKKKIREIEKSS